MANEIGKNMSGDEEYRPSGAEGANVFEASGTTVGKSGAAMADRGGVNFLEHLKRKNIMIAIGVLVAIFCVYKIADVLFTASPHAKIEPPLRARTPAPIQPAAAPAIGVAAPPAAIVAPNAGSPEPLPVAAASVNNRLNALEQQATVEQAALTKLSTQMDDMQTAMTNLDSKLSSLNDNLQIVAGQVAKQQEDLTARQAAKRKALAVKRTAPKPIYYVRAMIPGRAWLETQDGNTVTVSLGGNLSGYGTVEVINPDQGSVVTSSGAIIGYNPNDN